MSNQAQDPFTLVAALVRALSHRIRTPLSVITNDLTYFKSVIDPAECDRSLNKSKLISELLSGCSSIGSPTLLIAQTSLSTLSLPLPFQAVIGQQDINLLCDKERLSAALKLLAVLVDELVEKKGASDESFDFKYDKQEGQVSFCVSLTLPTTPATGSDQRNFFSLTQLVSLQLDYDSPYPPLIDAIIFGHKGSIKVTTSDTVSISLTVPAAPYSP